jgi:probable HAF family extracellular repeat protein
LNHSATLGKKDRKGFLSDDTLWTGKQRIHQYQQNVTETWGGFPFEIDRNLVDATIVPSRGVKQYTFQAPVEIDDGGIAGINNAVNDGTQLTMGTLVGPANADFDGQDPFSICQTSGNFIDPPVKGNASIPGLSYYCTGVSGINNLGQVIGIASTGSSNPFGFLYTPGAKQPLTLLPVDFYPSSINDAGWIVGVSADDGCELIKPPYTTPIPFYYIGPFTCPFADNSEVQGGWGYGMLAINGLGQIAGSYIEWISTTNSDNETTTTITQASAFIDDVESGTPAASDQPSILATTHGTSVYTVSGINNNGQIAGTFVPDFSWFFCTFPDPFHIADQDQAFFINTDGSMDSFNIPGVGEGYVSGINDDVQIVGAGCAAFPNCSTWEGFTVDTQH